MWGWKCPEVSRPGLSANGADSLCDASLWAPLSWSVQIFSDTQGKDMTGCLSDLSPSMFLPSNLQIILNGFSMSF